MPRPIYNEPRRNREDDRLNKLAVLAQILGGLNGQQQNAQQDGQRNALATLGLILQQQSQGAQAEETKRANDLRSGEFWGGELPLKYLAQENAQKEAQATRDLTAQHYGGIENLQRQGLENDQNWRLAQQTDEAAKRGIMLNTEQERLKAEKEAQQQGLLRTALSGYASLPSVTPESYSKLAAASGVQGFDTFNSANKEAILGDQTSKLQQILGPIYSQFGKQPHQAQGALDAVWGTDPRLQSPEIQARIQPWLQQQNEGIYNSQNPSITPEAVTAQRGQPLQGGLFGQGGTFDLRDQTPSDIVAQRNAYRQLHPEAFANPPGIFDFIFGRNKNTGSIYK